MNGSLGSEFIAFLDHIKDASEKCNQLFLEGSYDLENCKSPVHLKRMEQDKVCKKKMSKDSIGPSVCSCGYTCPSCH